jgi:hypothetical protein
MDALDRPPTPARRLLPEIERSVLDACCCSRAETAPSGDHAAL